MLSPQLKPHLDQEKHIKNMIVEWLKERMLTILELLMRGQILQEEGNLSDLDTQAMITHRTRDDLCCYFYKI